MSFLFPANHLRFKPKDELVRYALDLHDKIERLEDCLEVFTTENGLAHRLGHLQKKLALANELEELNTVIPKLFPISMTLKPLLGNPHEPYACTFLQRQT